MAAADFDRDGKLDLYLCCYVYFQSEAQYTYASPLSRTHKTGRRISYSVTGWRRWQRRFSRRDSRDGTRRKQQPIQLRARLVRFERRWLAGSIRCQRFRAQEFSNVNSGGHFRDRAAEAGVEDIGPGMSASWFDYDAMAAPIST